jgi:hypothetical protein
MSGGHFDYHQHQAGQFAGDLLVEIETIERSNAGEDIGDNWIPEVSDETLSLLKKLQKDFARVAKQMNHVDYFFSGDIGEEQLHERVSKEYTENSNG